MHLSQEMKKCQKCTNVGTRLSSLQLEDIGQREQGGRNAEIYVVEKVKEQTHMRLLSAGSIWGRPFFFFFLLLLLSSSSSSVSTSSSQCSSSSFSSSSAATAAAAAFPALSLGFTIFDEMLMSWLLFELFSTDFCHGGCSSCHDCSSNPCRPISVKLCMK